jgi:hypothetical protein
MEANNMRIRTMKPEFWTDSFMVNIQPLGRLTFLGLVNAADDHGYITDDMEEVAMQIMPKEDPVTIYGWIDFFYAAGKLEKYESDGGCFYRITNWEKHQRVDRPSKSKISREPSRKLAIPFETRRAVARKYNCPEGGEVEAHCYYCGEEGKIHWHRNYLKNRPSAWVTFGGLELDHFEPELLGGSNKPENIVLACRRCNRKKASKHWTEQIHKAVTREDSRELVYGSGIREQGTGNRESCNIAPNALHSVQSDPAETSPETSAQDQHQAEHLAEHGEEAEFAWEWDSEDSPEIHLHKAETHKPADVGGTRAAPPAVALDGFPLAKKGAEWSLTQDKLTEWQEAYPYIDVLAECRRARQWLRDNPAKRKTERGMSAFLSRWLNKGMDRGSTVQRPVTQPSPYRTEPEGWMDAYHRCKGRFDAKQQAMFAEQVAKGWYGMGITFREIIEDELEGRCTIL